MGSSMQPLPPVGNKSSFRHLSSNVNSTHSVSPTMSSPINCTSPVALSPLNKLQNMQPYDFRQEKAAQICQRTKTQIGNRQQLTICMVLIL
ncbi:zinc finger protein basonuclin-2 [Caerostris extrusa]|uniref:Zinc finger protein basonuclin-2 n=1 Tax=Caerostris extrusa TaxID=172846 RepID=A0AAV4MWC0_CAEEX|nr:zinc finger protein basonuclin-2 [Caerostris extrusa]